MIHERGHVSQSVREVYQHNGDKYRVRGKRNAGLSKMYLWTDERKSSVSFSPFPGLHLYYCLPLVSLFPVRYITHRLLHTDTGIIM